MPALDLEASCNGGSAVEYWCDWRFCSPGSGCFPGSDQENPAGIETQGCGESKAVRLYRAGQP
jgi:hypothetical protein